MQGTYRCTDTWRRLSCVGLISLFASDPIFGPPCTEGDELLGKYPRPGKLLVQASTGPEGPGVDGLCARTLPLSCFVSSAFRKVSTASSAAYSSGETKRLNNPLVRRVSFPRLGECVNIPLLLSTPWNLLRGPKGLGSTGRLLHCPESRDFDSRK